MARSSDPKKVALWQRPERVDMLGENDCRYDVERPTGHGFGKGLTEKGDGLRGRENRSALSRHDREEERSAGLISSSVFRHVSTRTVCRVDHT